MNWDTYFMQICQTISTNVKCPSRQIGVVIAKGHYIVSTGYNGPPSGFPHPTECTRKTLNIPIGQRLSLCPCAHAERNAISTAAKLGHSTEGTTLYMNSGIPCLDCAYSIVAAGITEVVIEQLEAYPQEGYTGEMILNQCGVAIRQAAI